MSATTNTHRQAATAAAPSHRNDLFSALISDIKTYSGKDPLFPWLRGIRTMKECLPAQLLKEKLPRFLQKCTQTFESDRRYKNDLRYIRVWLQLMDYVDDPGVLLKAMETNCIGTKRSLFYQAYALYYEKAKKYQEAEKMYHFGMQNLAEPMDDLKKSYEQFLHRMERNKCRKNQQHEKKFGKKPLSRFNLQENKENMSIPESQSKGTYSEDYPNQVLTENDNAGVRMIVDEKLKKVKVLIEGNGKVEARDDTVVMKFVDTAIVGKPQAEDARHHGLVEPTINMKEAIDTINGMFSEPIEVVPVKRKGTSYNQRKENQSCKSGFTVFIDEDSDEKIKPIQPQQKPLEIYTDEEETCDGRDKGHHTGHSVTSAFVFPRPKDLPSESPDELGIASSSRGKFREDTVVCRFVGSAILDDPLVENVCHHGLVDPTVNLKEAMEDINSMFGKPIDFVRTRRSKKNETPAEGKGHGGGFLILPDEDDDDFSDGQDQFHVPSDSSIKAQNRGIDPIGLSILPDDEVEIPQEKFRPDSLGKSRESDLFEPTLFTKEAMDDINKLFGMPLDL